MRSSRRFIRSVALTVSMCAAILLVGAGVASADTVWNSMRVTVVGAK